MEQKNKRQGNNKGFSLVELIVVIAIMAILVGAIAPQVVRYVERARVARDMQVESAILTAFVTAIGSSEETVDSFNISDINDTTPALSTSYGRIRTEVQNISGYHTNAEIHLRSDDGNNGAFRFQYDADSGEISVQLGALNEVTND